MKIQSSLLVCAAMVGSAMVGSATAANKRKRVFKIYSREEIQAADGTRSLQGGDDKTEETVPAATPMSIETIITSAPTAMSMMTKCAFCHGLVMPDPEFALPNDQTCASVKAIADDMDVTNKWCVQLKQAEQYCCMGPPVVETTTTTTTSATTAAAMMSMPTTTEAAVVETETTTTATTTTTEAASVPTSTPPSQETLGAPSGAMILETTLAALTVVAGAMMLV